MDKAGAFYRSVQAFRQLGSTIKPFVYATALEHGYMPTSIFMDTDISINLDSGKTWNPANHNLTTNGPTTLRIGLEKSKNTITVRIAEAVGIRDIRKTFINSGISKNPESNLSITLGTLESSLINIVSAFSIFATNGKIPTTYLISSIKHDSNTSTGANNDNYGKIYFSDCNLQMKCKINFFGKRIQSKKPITIDETEKTDGNDNYDYINENKSLNPQRTPISPESAYQIANILQGAVKRGTSSRLAFLHLPIGAKTGTSDGGKDMWTIAFSQDYVIGSYVGYDTPIETNNYGAEYALPIVKDILSYLSEKEEIRDITPPDGIKFVKINRFTGKQTTRNENAIFEAFKENDNVEMEDESDISDEQYTDITDL